MNPEKLKRLRERRRAEGRCVQCGRDSPGESRCARCRDRRLICSTELQTLRWESGVCVICGKNPYREGRVTCEECALKMKIRTIRHLRRRDEDRDN